MNKLSRLIFAAALLTGTASFATETISDEALSSALVTMAPKLVNNFITFKVGDTLNFNLKLSIGLSGTMSMTVTAQDTTTVTITQIADLTVQKQTIVEVIDKTNGKIISVTVNGQPQTPPDSASEKVIKQEPAHITVPAGTYDCIHVVVRPNTSPYQCEL